MPQARYEFFPPEALKVSGWLKRQLQTQASGLCGNLDAVWPDVRDSRWIGGDREGWERFPYWLDGLIPLAVLLDDPVLKSKAEKYVSAILSRQEPDGWPCPCPQSERAGYDVWAVFLICKVLTAAADCFPGQKPHIITAVSRALKCLQTHIAKFPLFNWGKFRWFECLIPIEWLNRQTPEPWLAELAAELRRQGFDYRTLIDRLPQTGKSKNWSYELHVVNLAMALKGEALGIMTGSGAPDKSAATLLQAIRARHGNAWGLFNGDECLAGNSPIQGTELCAVVEAMYSEELLLAATGDPEWGDRLELLAFNALPAAVSADMWTHQYDQEVNQIGCLIEKTPVWTTNNGESGLFGLEPCYGCCTANFGQGWPKLALASFMRSQSGIFSAVLLPSSVDFRHDGVNATCMLETGYPFNDTLNYIVTAEKALEFTLEIRIPKSAVRATVDGRSVLPGKICAVRRVWPAGRSEVRVKLEFEPRLETRPYGLHCARRGNLVFALPIQGEWRKLEYVRDNVERKFPYCDYEVAPVGDWNFAFADAKLDAVRSGNDIDFFKSGDSPLALEATMRRLTWRTAPGCRGVCSELPESDGFGLVRKIRLIPYGFTTLRLTEMPLFPAEMENS